jgi:predicted nuclease of predicted toxin-antitoxin system
MKFKVDENLPREVCSILIQGGHEAVSVIDQGLTGGSDEEVFSRCKREARCLITKDKDFAQIRSVMHAGIIVLRLENAPKPSILRRITALLSQLPERSLLGQLWIVEADRIRKRGIKYKHPTWTKKIREHS